MIRKEFIGGILWLLLVAGIACDADAQKVYITKTGAKYHRKDCRYLRYSSIEIDLKEAKKTGYTPCSVRRPATKGAGSPPTTANTQPQPSTNQVTPLYKDSTPEKTTS